MPFGTLRPTGRARKLKIFVTAACMTFTVISLTGCGLWPFGKEQASPYAPKPPSQMSPLNGDDKAITTQAGATDNSPKEGLEEYEQVPIPPPVVIPMDPIIAAGPLQLDTKGSMGSLGLNLDEYFNKDEDAMTRITKIERAVSAIQKDIKTMAPPIKRLVAVERDIQELVAQLAELAQEPPKAAPPPAVNASALSKPNSLFAAPPPQNYAPPMHSMSAQPAMNGMKGGAGYSAGHVNVKGLRVGEHKDKTRIVLDVSGPASYRYDLDNAESLLVIELANATWSGKTQGQPRKSPLISSYNVYPSNGGSRVVIQLKKNTSISYETVLKPNGKSFYRIVLDLKK